ncbi:hypothetical protein MLS210_09240 [Helicobacter pylori]
MEENRDGHAIVSNVIKLVEKSGFFSPSDREKFAQIESIGLKVALLKRLLTFVRHLVLSIAMKIGLMGAIWKRGEESRAC